MFGWYQNCFYLCTRFSEVKYSGCSAVRLAHLLWEQGVVGSNPATPTSKKSLSESSGRLFLRFVADCPILPILARLTRFLPVCVNQCVNRDLHDES